MIFDLLFDSIKRNKLREILISVQCFITYIIIILALSLQSNVSKQVVDIQKSALPLYQLHDNFFGKEERQFYFQANHLGILKNLYDWECSSPLFSYIIANKQPVGTDILLPDLFQYGYEAGTETPCIYNSVQVNAAFFAQNSIKCDSGRLFANDDYSVNNKIVPIILGSDYKEYLDINQKINIHYMGEEFVGNIIGFLKQYTYYNNGYDLQYLDRFIVMPSFEVESLQELDSDFLWKLYLDKCSGYISTSLPPKEIQDAITEKCLQLDILPYSLEGISDFYLTMWGLEGGQLQNILFTFLIVIAMASLIALSLNVAAKIVARKVEYGILIANGISRRPILVSIFLEIFLTNFIAMLFAFLISAPFVAGVNLFQLLICNIFFSSIAFLIPRTLISKLKICDLIRGVL